MTKHVMHASLAGLMAAALVAAAPADARRVRPTPTPPPTPTNNDEWALIGLTADILAQANKGSGVTVSVLDGLTDCAHSDLTGRCTANQIAGGRYRGFDPHGTHTAGIVAGKTVGVAPLAKVLNYGVFDSRNFVATGTKLIGAWADAKAKGASIASMSFGCTRLAYCFSTDEVKAMGGASLPLLFVKAAGNDGATLLNENVAVTQSEALAALQRTILVGSVELNKSMSSYSNRPGEACLLYSGASGCSADMQWKYYFIVAPGSSIYSTLPNNKFGMMSGTSMATPMVAGAAALLQARWPALKTNPEMTADILFTTATDLGAPGVDGVFGWGLLNIGKAFQAQGNVTMFSAGAEAQGYWGESGSAETVNGSAMSISPTMAGLGKALGRVTVFDRYGRDFALAETGALQVRTSYDARHQLLGRRLIGLGSQAEWASALFATKHAPLGFASFASFADPAASGYQPDQSLRMGIDMPFKGGVAQLRMTGESGARVDFAHDPSLRPLSFFASTALLKSSVFGQALFNLTGRSRLAVYGTSNSPGSVQASSSSEPYFLRADGNSTARLALTGSAQEMRQHGFGIGYWAKPDRATVVGLNASYLMQEGGYYNMASSLPGLQQPARMINLGGVASRAMGSWEASASGEVTHIRTSGTSGAFRLTPANIVSAELRLRKAGVAFDGNSVADSLSIALVMPPRIVSGSLVANYMDVTADGLGREAASFRYALSGAGADPVKVEAGYQLTAGQGWSMDLTGGVNLASSDYRGRGEALASFHLGF